MNFKEYIHFDNILLVEADEKQFYNQFKKIPYNDYKKILDADPSSQKSGNFIKRVGKLSKLALMIYNKKKFNLDNLDKLFSALEVYEKKQSLVKPNEKIQNIKSIEDLYKITDKLENQQTKNQKKQAIRKSESDIEIFDETDNWAIIIPLTKQSAIKWGRNCNHAHWCTSADSDENMFYSYAGDGDLYIFYNKNNPEKSAQYHMPLDPENPTDYEFRDINDKEIDENQFIKENPELKPVFDKIKNEHKKLLSDDKYRTDKQNKRLIMRYKANPDPKLFSYISANVNTNILKQIVQINKSPVYKKDYKSQYYSGEYNIIVYSIIDYINQDSTLKYSEFINNMKYLIELNPELLPELEKVNIDKFHNFVQSDLSLILNRILKSHNIFNYDIDENNTVYKFLENIEEVIYYDKENPKVIISINFLMELLMEELKSDSTEENPRSIDSVIKLLESNNISLELSDIFKQYRVKYYIRIFNSDLLEDESAPITHFLINLAKKNNNPSFLNKHSLHSLKEIIESDMKIEIHQDVITYEYINKHNWNQDYDVTSRVIAILILTHQPFSIIKMFLSELNENILVEFLHNFLNNINITKIYNINNYQYKILAQMLFFSILNINNITPMKNELEELMQPRVINKMLDKKIIDQKTVDELKKHIEKSGENQKSGEEFLDDLLKLVK